MRKANDIFETDLAVGETADSRGNRNHLKFDAVRYGSAILVLYLAGIFLLLCGVRQYPALLGMAVISFTFGLRHAFDVDHIAAIDNMTRKMVHEKKNARGTGFFFSLGHSLVVITMSVVTIFGIRWVTRKIPAFQTVGGILGTSISGIFLLFLASINLWIVRDIWLNFRAMRQKGYSEQEHITLKNTWFNRQAERLLKIVNHNWQVMIVGFLFGLGFDTATQIAVLATSATASNQGAPWFVVMSFPILFTAGMCTMDTLDGFFMSSAYQWVFTSPLKKVYYNLTVTLISILAAGVIGIIEVLQVIGMQAGINHGFIAWIQNLNLNSMGFILVGIFVVVWGIALAFWKILRLGSQEQHIEAIK